MSRKRKDGAPAKPAAKSDSSKDEKSKAGLDKLIIHGIWGLIHLLAGVVMLIALLFYSGKQLTGGREYLHVLGPHFGTSLALGMFYIFGRVSAFALPVALCYIGALTFMNRQVNWKLVLFGAALSAELCLLFAVGSMGKLSAGGLALTAEAAGSNYVGLFMANALVPLFKGQTLGPYLITALLMVITVMIGLRIKPQWILSAAAKVVIGVVSLIKRAFAGIKRGIASSPGIRKKTVALPVEAKPANTNADDGKKEPAKKKGKEKAPPAAPSKTPEGPTSSTSTSTAIPVDKTDTADAAGPVDAGPLSEEEELERLRSRVKISTIKTADIEPPLDDEYAAIPAYTDDDDNLLADLPTDDGVSEGEEMADVDDGLGGQGGGGDYKVDVFKKPSTPYRLPSPDVLDDPPSLSEATDKEAIYRNSGILEKTLRSFGIKGEVKHVSPGPVVTRYEMEIEAGTKVSRVVNLQNDISLAVGGLPVRIQAPIPGKAAIGIELPNAKRQNIYFKNILTSDAFNRSRDTSDIPVVIGTNISGEAYVTDIAKTPHLLIAGTTGSGKSVCMNALICSMLMTRTPEELRLIMIDPKVVEMANFGDIPHLLAPVVTEPKEAVKALQWGVNEMERRYRLLGKSGAKKLETFNERVKNGELDGRLDEEENRPLPLIVIIIDELADLMMTASKDVEALIMRITQKARAAGIHLIVATQRPSVDIVTGKIKSNLPSRIGFRTVQAVDSRTILDRVGTEKLLGLGDMLFLRSGATDIERFHGAFISEKEVEAIVDDIRKQGVEMQKIDSFHDVITDEGSGGDGAYGGEGGGDRDPMFFEAAKMTVQIGQGSTSLLQTRLKIGFARARRIMDEMEQAGIVGPSKGGKVREVLISPADLADYL